MVPERLNWLYQLFWRMTHFRSVAVGLSVVHGAIPFEALDRMARRLRLEGDEFDHYLSCMIGMDQAYMKFLNRPRTTKKE